MIKKAEYPSRVSMSVADKLRVDGRVVVKIDPTLSVANAKKEGEKMSCCGGGCGCEKKKDEKSPRLELRDVGKVCLVCDVAYLASGSFLKKNSKGLDTTHHAECGWHEVLAYLPKCWCGLTIHPRDKNCWHYGHKVCRCENRAECPGWHDYSEMHETA